MLLSEANICTVCQEPLHARPVTALGCGHAFHHTCVARWVSGYRQSCPICRYPVPMVPRPNLNVVRPIPIREVPREVRPAPRPVREARPVRDSGREVRPAPEAFSELRPSPAVSGERRPVPKAAAAERRVHRIVDVCSWIVLWWMAQQFVPAIEYAPHVIIGLFLVLSKLL